MIKFKLLLISMVIMASVYSSPFDLKRHLVKQDSITLYYLNAVKRCIDSLDIKEPIYVLAQACYESGWFKCNNCTWNNNNMFGFRGLNGKYMKFPDWISCIVYYANWQNKRYPKFLEKHPKGTYIEFLKWSRYAESTVYSKSITITYNFIVRNYL